MGLTREEEEEAGTRSENEEVESNVEGSEGEEEEEEEPEKSPEKLASPALRKKAKTKPAAAADPVSKAAAKKPKASAPSSTAMKEKEGPTHPKYEEMIVEAITELKSRSGSSKSAILKVLKAKYNLGDNETRIATSVKLALKKGLEKGVFKMAKEEGKGSQSYKLGEKANDVLKKPKAKAKAKPKTDEADKKKAEPKPKKEAVTKKTAKTLSKEKASAK